MPFDSAIPLNRIAYGRTADFDGSTREESAYRKQEAEHKAKQSVNISHETMMKVARAKLGRMVSQRSAYDQRGALSTESSVGSLLSAKA